MSVQFGWPSGWLASLGRSIFIGGDLVAKLSCKIRREMGNFSLVSSVGGAAQCCRGAVI